MSRKKASLLSVLLLLMAAPCVWANPSASDEAVEVITLWTYRGDSVVEPLLEAFTRETGLAVDYRVLGGDGIVDAMLAGDEPAPDVVLMVDALRADRLKAAGLLRPLPADALVEIEAPWHDLDHHWSGIAWRARGIVRARHDTDLVDFASLAELAQRGEVCMRPGDHIYNRSLLAWLMATMGDAAALDWMQAVMDHRVSVDGGDRDQILAVAAGQCRVAVVNHYYLTRWQASDDAEVRSAVADLTFGWPDADSPVMVNVSVVAQTAEGANPEGGEALARWLLGSDAQVLYAAAVFEYPVTPVAAERKAPGLAQLTLRAEPPWPAGLGVWREAAERFFDSQ